MTNRQQPTVNPKSAYSVVFVFPIHHVLVDGGSVYEATRRSWNVAPLYRELPAHAVGLVNGISKGVFEVNRWTPHLASGKWEFTGRALAGDHELADSNWVKVIDAAKAYWRYGQYLVVEFDGKGWFRILRGSADHQWQNL
jgi:hypothetical protein